MKGMVGLAFVTGLLAGFVLAVGILGPERHLVSAGASAVVAGVKAMHAELARQLRVHERDAFRQGVLRRPVVMQTRQAVNTVVLWERPSASMFVAGGSADARPAVTTVRVSGPTSESVKHNEPLPSVRVEAKNAARPASRKKDTLTSRPSTPVGSTSVMSEQAAYARALHAYQRGDYAQSRRLFRQFQQTYPRSLLQANAAYWTGETWYAERCFARAEEAFGYVVRHYGAHAKSADALLKMAYCRFRLGDSAQAKQILDRLATEYPGSRANTLGRQALRAHDASDSGMRMVAHG